MNESFIYSYYKVIVTNIYAIFSHIWYGIYIICLNSISKIV
jgi:hypothetical protein